MQVHSTKQPHPMRFTFLGTSAGLPTRERNVTALAIAPESAREWYLVDCGEGTQHQLLQTRYSAAKLRAVFITHVHGDHCYGLPGLIASAQMGRRQEPLTICAPAGIEEFIDAVRRHTDLMRLTYPLHFVRSDAEDFEYRDENFHVTSVELSHRVPSFAFRFTEQVHERTLDTDKLDALGIERGPLWGELQHGHSVQLTDGRTIAPEQVCYPQRDARRVVVGGDNDQPALLIDAMRDSDMLIHEATFTEAILAKVGPQYQHSTPAQVAAAAQQAQLKHLVLTHFSQRYRRHKKPGEHAIDDLFDEARALYRGNLLMADDFASLELTRDKQLIASAHE
ncbi:MAG: RNAse [Verrucomicrobiaceae bacterium]|nr:RNAse [Verrucomicrobiaceae bacterium]